MKRMKANASIEIDDDQFDKLSKKTGLSTTYGGTQKQKCEPINLIYIDQATKQFKTNPEGLKVIQNLSKINPSACIGVVSINGMQRTGKSYLLN